MDERILELFWKRSEDAIREAEKAYGRYLHYISYGILKNDDDARETVNDVYWKAWNVIPPQRPNPLRAFLGRIARQLSINRLEERLAQKRGGGQYALALEELEECISHPNEEDPADRIALQDALNKFLRSLPKEARRIFLRRYWYMQSVGEIAKALSVSESKVKSVLFRTRNKLKEHLEKEGFTV